MPSYLLYDSAIEPSNVSSVTNVPNIGTLVNVTDINKIYNRSILDNYQFTNNSSFATYTLTINLTDTIDAEGIAILGVLPSITISSVEFFFDAVKGSDCTEITTRERIIEGIPHKDYVYSLDSDIAGSANKIVISYSDPNLSTDTGYFSSVYVGEKLLELDISPTSLRYSAGSNGTKIRTDGGQIVASEPSSWQKVSFFTTATEETSVISDHFNVNQTSSINSPLVFVPQSGKDVLIYGTQEKTNSTRTLLGKKNNEWLYETQFQLEEEL